MRVCIETCVKIAPHHGRNSNLNVYLELKYMFKPEHLAVKCDFCILQSKNRRLHFCSDIRQILPDVVKMSHSRVQFQLPLAQSASLPSPRSSRRLLSKVGAGDTMPVYNDIIGTWKPQVRSLVCNLKYGFCRATTAGSGGGGPVGGPGERDGGVLHCHNFQGYVQ